MPEPNLNQYQILIAVAVLCTPPDVRQNVKNYANQILLPHSKGIIDQIFVEKYGKF